MKGRTKSAISMVLAIAVLLTTMLSSTLFSGVTAKAATSAQVVLDNGSRDVDFNEGWQFMLATRTPSVASGSNNGSNFATYGCADVAGLATDDIIRNDYDDSSWRTLTVPHDFSIEGPKLASGSAGSAQGYMQGGLGWYRKSFVLPESMQGKKRITLDFEGVYQNSNVYLNGQLVGNYPSGYTGFAFDVTDLVTYGETQPNVLVVKVQNMASSGRWYTGSGIIRPVHLIVNDYVRFVRQGVKLTSPDLKAVYTEDGSANLKVDAVVYSDASNGVMRLRTTVFDKNGQPVKVQESSSQDINPTTRAEASDTLSIPSVNLWYPWNLGDPYLYTVQTELIYAKNGGEGDEIVDSVSTKFGFRWFNFDSFSSSDLTKGGLYINGKYTKINGVDLHHDSGALGAVSIKDAYERQFGILKTMGVNSYRTSHCPPSKQVIEVCSENGFIVMEEAYDGWGSAKATYDFGNFFLRPVPANWPGLAPNGYTTHPVPAVNYDGAQYLWSDWVVREMVMRDINEASVLMWSIGNEIRGMGTRPSWYDGTKYRDASGVTGTTITATNITEFTEAVRLGEDVKALDSTRSVAMGGDQQRSAPGFSSNWGWVNQYLDGYGLNYNTAASINTLMDRFAGTFFFESESSSQTSSRGVYLDASIKNSAINQTPGRRGGSNYDNDFASWTMSNEYGLKKDRDNKAFTGQYIWSGFDYIGEPTPYSVFPVGVSSFGTIDTAGFPKDSYYLFRSQWTDKQEDPMVHIVPGNWTDWQPGEDVDVWINSNVRTVELFLNGVSLGTKSFDVKSTGYGKEYYETSELNPDDKTWPSTGDNAGNPGGYVSTNATVVNASGDSSIAAGSKFGRLHLTWKVPFAAGTLEAKAYTDATKTQLVATDKVVTAGDAYTVQMKANKEVIKADGRALTYVECTVVDKNGNVVPKANNLIKFDVTGGAIVGVDNGQQENAELYKWGNVERNSHSERTAYSGKVLVILQSNKGEIGTLQLTAKSDGMRAAVKNIAVTADGTGAAPSPATLNPTAVYVKPVNVATQVGIVPTLPKFVSVNFTDPAAGFYTEKKAVVWNAIAPAQVVAVTEEAFVVEGVVDGVSMKAIANVLVADGTKTDVALNTALGNNNVTFDFASLAASDPIRNGAMATATFTSGITLYPNNMLNGSTSNYWNNACTRAASVVLPAYNWSRARDSVEFFWDKARQFGEIDMEFAITTTGSTRYSLPSSMTVQYWNGGEWVNVSNLSINLADTSYGVSTLTFDTVISDRVRVNMVSPTPYSTVVEGVFQIRRVNIMGYNFNELLPPDIPSVQGVVIDKTSAVMHIEDEIQLTSMNIPAEADQAVTWTSSDSNVVTVDTTGKMVAMGAGSATVTATTVEGGFKATCTVTVKARQVLKVKTGDIVAVPITVEECTKLSGLTGQMTYDSELLEFQSMSPKTGHLLLFDQATKSFVWVAPAGAGITGTNVVVGYALFKVKADLLDDVTTLVRFPKVKTSGVDETLGNTDILIPTIEIAIDGIPLGKGDINGDGVVDTGDAIMLMQYLAGSRNFSPRQLKAADVNNDGKVNVGDTVLIMQMCLD